MLTVELMSGMRQFDADVSSMDDAFHQAQVRSHFPDTLPSNRPHRFVALRGEEKRFSSNL
jgi:hypothetical protein